MHKPQCLKFNAATYKSNYEENDYIYDIRKIRYDTNTWQNILEHGFSTNLDFVMKKIEKSSEENTYDEYKYHLKIPVRSLYIESNSSAEDDTYFTNRHNKFFDGLFDIIETNAEYLASASEPDLAKFINNLALLEERDRMFLNKYKSTNGTIYFFLGYPKVEDFYNSQFSKSYPKKNLINPEQFNNFYSAILGANIKYNKQFISDDLSNNPEFMIDYHKFMEKQHTMYKNADRNLIGYVFFMWKYDEKKKQLSTLKNFRELTKQDATAIEHIQPKFNKFLSEKYNLGLIKILFIMSNIPIGIRIQVLLLRSNIYHHIFKKNELFTRILDIC